MPIPDSPTSQIRERLGRYILADGHDFLLDIEKSQGCYLYDGTNNRYLLDFFTYFATNPLGHNHPGLVNDESFNQKLLTAAQSKPSNSDFYTDAYLEFVETFGDIAMPSPYKYAFFISGGALAVENALKVAMDWKVQKNFQKGYPQERGHQVLHFVDAFHGRSGYTLSLTNTSPEKTKYFAKFQWPRVINPKVTFPLDEHKEEVLHREEEAIEQIITAFENNEDDICAIIIEPIQSEGGDHHFRAEFLQQLRQIADEQEALLIFDEVQTGVGLTGTFWAYEHFDVVPDIISFGKKMQTCGIIATDRIDDIETNCFHVPSRINSTWGGNLVDMVRASKILKIIKEEKLVDNARLQGDYLLGQLQSLGESYPISNIRGRGLQCAFDLPSAEQRDTFQQKLMANNLLLLDCGERSMRFRPPLTVQQQEIDESMDIIQTVLRQMF